MPSFKSIISDNCVYVDKGGILKNLLTKSSVLFIARPRRFGKSVLLDMLLRLYSGESYLFEGTALESKAQNMPPCHVVRMSWAEILTADSVDPENTLKANLIQLLHEGMINGASNVAEFRAQHHELLMRAKALSDSASPISPISDVAFGGIIKDLLTECYDSARPYVLLIDEYDAPANAFLYGEIVIGV